MEAPAWWAFPPSFTLQPVADTRAKQVASWGDFVVGHCRWAAPRPPSPAPPPPPPPPSPCGAPPAPPGTELARDVPAADPPPGGARR